MEIREIKLNKLVILILLILVMFSTILICSLETKKYLSRKHLRKITIETIMRDRISSSLLLGKLLYDSFPHNTTLLIPKKEIWQEKEFYERYRFNKRRIYYHSYPISIKFGNYNCFLKKKDFDFLIKNSKSSVQSEVLTFYLIKSDDPKIALFIYEDNVVLAPMRWYYAENK